MERAPASVERARADYRLLVRAAHAPPKPRRGACRQARRAARYYTIRLAYWRRQMGERTRGIREGRAGPCPLARARELRELAIRARARAERWRAYQYGWEQWLPAVWYRLARCETGVNWAHDSGSYVSAFGIYRQGYADDAHRIGDLSWDETRARLGRLPTPRAQFDAALSHYAANGGFSGWGCRGA